MILADKIIALRKKNGWSQEELAEKLNVTRQSVSKWEGAQSVPDLDRILQMSRIFGVSTDYLLRDELEEEEYTEENVNIEELSVRKVSMEEANAFLTVKKETAGYVAFATLLCVLSPIALLLLAAAQEAGMIGITENAAGGIGMCVLLIFIAVAVVIFILSGMKTREFEYLDSEVIETEYGVTGMVKERKKQYESTYIRNNVLGAAFCILSVLPLFIGVIFTENDFILVEMLCLLLVLAGIGVMFFIKGGINHTSMQKLLQEGDYSKKKKQEDSNPIAAIYWPVVTAIFLGYSFITNDWGRSWIIWPVAGVLFGAVMAIYNAVKRNGSQKDN